MKIPDSTLDLSVIIVSWNTRDLLVDCLRTVYEDLENAPEITAEVIVVDNASTDGSVMAVQTHHPTCRIIENKANLGFAKANNLAIQQSHGRYCLLLNSDTLVRKGALEALVHVLDAHPAAAVAAPLLLNKDKSAQINWAKFQNLLSEIRGDLIRSQSPYPLEFYDDPERRITMKTFDVDWVGGACYLARTEAIRLVGLMDEGFFMYGEEAEWCYRFLQGGWQTLLVPYVTVTHLGGQSSKAVPKETRKRMWKSSLRFYRQLYGPFGSLLPSLVASGRYMLSGMKRLFDNQTQGLKQKLEKQPQEKTRGT